MSIIIPNKNSVPVYYPKTDYRIAKYLDLTKFTSLLYQKSLFFCRLDILEDYFEGRTPSINASIKYNNIENAASNLNMKPTSQKIDKMVETSYKHEERHRSDYCVCCWNKNELESAALWKIYSSFQNGIMITSTVRRLESAFQNTSEDLNLSEIKYKNYKNNSIPEGNTIYPVIHKQKAYSYEEVLRLIYQVTNNNGLAYDWSKEKVYEGKYIEIELNHLIDEVIVSPNSPKWFLNLVKNLMIKYGLEKKVNPSELSPTY
jgi:hypothetical protein